ncbi:MAG: DEAD/DEAH box helicase family protein [Candidatus Helarchaeota archaeon]|nr:DEAD/DEAH box helicase family protein [Candidatus Helarchaeota archaeon]
MTEKEPVDAKGDLKGEKDTKGEKELVPRNYQINARDQAIQMVDEGKKVILVLLPTGMGKTLIITLTIEALIENGTVKKEDKVLFLVNDRKLKYQLYDMAQSHGLGQYGDLFVLPEGDTAPRITREQARLSKFIFATPILLLNSIIARTPAQIKLERATLDQMKVVVIDEIFDVLAQSYGKRRSQEESIEYIQSVWNVNFEEVVESISQKYNIEKERVAQRLIQEFSAKYYRMNKKFEPVLNLLGVLNESKKLVLGMTASLSQREKLDLLIKTLGGPEKVGQVYPTGEDFEDYTPSYVLKKIVVFDDWVSDLDDKIKELKLGTIKSINQAYKIITNREQVPNDRIMLFISDILGKPDIHTKLKEARGEQFLNQVMSHASAYLLLTVMRQNLLENTLLAFTKFVARVKNAYLTNHPVFNYIKEKIEDRKKELHDLKLYISKKEERLLFWVNRFLQEGKKALVLCRFVSVTQYLHQLMLDKGVETSFVHGKMDGALQHTQIMKFKKGESKVLFASERLIEKGTDLPEADVAVYYGTTVSLEKYEQSIGRIRSTRLRLKTVYTLSYHQTVEEENAFKRDALFLEILGKKHTKFVVLDEEEEA